MDLTKAIFLNGGNELGAYGIKHKESAAVIQKALVKHGFINAGLNDAIHLWSEYSESYAAGWIGGCHPDDIEYHNNENEFLDEVFKCVKPYIRKYVYPED
jgi:hypothetical protein